jgi:hypothetical protein
MRGEPEAVPEDAQRRITAEANRRESEVRIRAWRTAHSAITEAVATFKMVCPSRGPVGASLRSIDRTAARLDREVAAG